LKDKFEIEEERKTVKDVVGACKECQQTKTDTSKTKEETIKITSWEAFERVYIDIWGPWRETIRKKCI